MFYAAYTAVTFGIAHLAGKGKGAWRQMVFIGCCLLCAVPFFYIRFRELFPELPLLFGNRPIILLERLKNKKSRGVIIAAGF